MEIYIKNGSPMNGPSICESCSWGFVARGYRETELLVVCRMLYPERRMRFPVRLCSAYTERNRPGMKQMEDIALILDRSDLKRGAGFVPGYRTGDGAEQIDMVSDENSQ